MTTPHTPATDPDAATATPPQVSRMIVLMLANLALSALLTGLMLVFQEHLLDYQLAHLDLPAGPIRPPSARRCAPRCGPGCCPSRWSHSPTSG
ncbi:hypothetical protein [Micromonospora fulviviridis]|uniref:MFS transporter n=1 Tax=Micromonospora fulviviridis TaxID=47860 RepID=A0ABV2VL05_9ACTN